MPSRFAEVVDGTVTRVFRRQMGGLIEDTTDTVSPGWTYADGQFTAPPAPPPEVPAYVTKLGLKRACEQQTDWGGSGSNLWQIAKQAIAALGESEQDEWNLATQVPRENSAFVALATSPAIGATEEQIDNVFILAKTLE